MAKAEKCDLEWKSMVPQWNQISDRVPRSVAAGALRIG